MSFTAEQFDKAFAELQEFGPRRRISIEQRWRETLPEIDPQEFTVLRSLCKEIEDFAYDLAVQIWDKKLSDELARKQLAQKFPSLTPERLSRTWSQAMYFASK